MKYFGNLQIIEHYFLTFSLLTLEAPVVSARVHSPY